MLEEDIRYRYTIIYIDTFTPLLYPILCIHEITVLKYISKFLL